MKRSLLLLISFCISCFTAGTVGSGTAEGRPAGRQEGRKVRALPVVMAANRDSLESMVEFLSIDPATSQSRSRFTFREMEIGEMADSLSARLERYTGSPVTRDSFNVDYRFDLEGGGYYDSTFTAENIVGRIDASSASYGVILMTAHYDAIGSRTDDWWYHWQDWPAPGANDNATGVAAVMEAARILAGHDLPFDVEFVLFSGEELGRLGSIDFVEKCNLACAQEIIGVINADMLGYSDEGTGTSIMSNMRSGWLAEVLADAAAWIDPDLPVTVIKPGPSNWDHASFWEREEGRIPAVTFAEPLGERFGNIIYPWYHTVWDLPARVDIEQTGRILDIVLGFFEHIDTCSVEISMLESDMLLLVDGRVQDDRIFETGISMSPWIRVRNLSGEVMPGGTSVYLDVRLTNSGGTRTVFSSYISRPLPMRSVDVEIPLELDASYGGENLLTARVDVAGIQESEANNSASISFVVEGGGGATVKSHHFRPNPINGSFRDSRFCLNLSGEANLVIEIFTIEGESVAVGFLGASYGKPLSPGYSCHSCGELFPGTEEPAAGIYLYRVKVVNEGGGEEKYTGRFAIVN